MTGKTAPLAIDAAGVAPREKASAYPEPFASRVAGRVKRQLGSVFGLTNLGINMTVLEPGAESSLLHRHSAVDEFVFILQGTPTLVTDQGEMELAPGMCAGFPKGGLAHHLVNRSNAEVTYLEISDRAPGDAGDYPADDLKAVQDGDGRWIFTRKDGTPY
ncbi:cupin [Zhengella mangrovi]|uniref:Cupin n=1 Tax=Zhengella mangrovi TaxID=1982044 RepID=A0A2G1QKY3_9HYPH|nr:cupin domain-containing protein [Zhengella mangrovi]PHP66110.1 cupin [Zhengella mangrovi]